MPATIFFAATLVATWAAWIVWKYRRALGGSILIWLIASVLLWTFAETFAWAVPTLQAKVIWIKAGYPGMVSAAPLLLYFSLVYTRRTRWITRLNLLMLWLLPLVSLLAALSTEQHQLLWTSRFPNQTLGFIQYSSTYAILFWLYSIYAHACLVVSAMVFIQEQREIVTAYRAQYRVFLAACLFPLAGSLLILFDLNPLPGLDISVLSFVLSIAAIASGARFFGSMSLAPIARNKVVDMIADGIVVIDLENRVVDVNQAVLSMFGMQKPPLNQEIFDAFREWPALAATFLQKSSAPMEFPLPARPGHVVDVSVTEVIGERGNTEGYIAILRDISDRKQIELALQNKSRELERMAITDDLTGLYNRRQADKVLEQGFRRAERQRMPLALCIFDIDDFKQLNDTRGHAHGDEALRVLARALRKNLRPGDTAARMGGDEFVVIFPNSHAQKAGEIMELVREDLWIRDHACGPVKISLSGGITSRKQGESPLGVLRRADHLLYEAKQQGKNRFLCDS